MFGSGDIPPELLAQLQEMLELEQPSLDELRADIAELPQQPLNWLVAIQPLDLESLDFPMPEGMQAYLCMLARPEGEDIGMSEICASREEAERMVLEALLLPLDEDTPPYRPQNIATPDAQQAFALGNVLRDTGIGVEVEPTGEWAKLIREAMDEAMEHATQHGADVPEPLLVSLPDKAVREYVAAYGRFVRMRAWEVLKPDKPMLLEWQDENGNAQHIFATAMGDMGETFGLSFYPDWQKYSDFIHNSHRMDLLMETYGGFEGVSQAEQGAVEFEPQDWAMLERLGLSKKRHLPALHHLSLEGLKPVQTPVWVVTAALNILAERAGKRPGVAATSLKGEQDGVRARYPAKPDMDLVDDERGGTVTICVSGGYGFEDGQMLTITAPSDMPLRKVTQQLRKAADLPRELRDPFMAIKRTVPSGQVFGLGGGSMAVMGASLLCFYSGGASQGLPDLTAAHLARLDDLESSSGGNQITATLTPHQPCSGVSWKLE